ncbi:hypothetical protein [Ruegeria atlantica]|uniref:hypothetical protein n=1 Tax=Ruegeria atlantica TaxID=81569 RepID=UPI002494B58D|nr:hypothetical protein [Ruegeria atlantica]
MSRSVDIDPTAQVLGAANFDVQDMDQMMVAIRSANVRGRLWPTQIALLGLNASGKHYWTSPIYPALSWPQQILDLSDIDLRDAPAATDVARECLERISRASGGWIHAEDPAHTKRLLDTLTNEAQLGFASDATVIPVDVQWGPEGEAAAQRVREYLENNPPSRDPVQEAFRLARAWESGYP